MLLIIFLVIILCTPIVTLFQSGKNQLIVPITEASMVALIAAVIYYACAHTGITHNNLTFLNYDGIKLILSFQFDMLTKIMVIYILIIWFFIYHYAQRYLESDKTRIRFLSQLKLVLFSVLMLVMAANLLTAFVAWQFIGMSLYLLLNHYHHDPAANRAAKKKFVINRIGDCSFLLAIVLAYQTHSATSFASISLSPHANLISCLLFLSVMTKCAQFPFHIWLLDTMETPTPVSALMHAGVINAGGILLTRVSDSLVGFHVLAYAILLIGLTSAVLSVHWMNQQPDTKKKLAYSTMGQMGYMLVQCSVGAFPAAIFHLISHGFYKACLFLNAGETLNNNHENHCKPASHALILKSWLISAIVLGSGLILFKAHSTELPVLLYSFVFLTMASMTLKINQIMPEKSGIKLMAYVAIVLIYYFYLFFLHAISSWLATYSHTHLIPIPAQLVLTFILLIAQYALWRKGKIQLTEKMTLKDRTEFYFRTYLLSPIRSAGEIINVPRYKNAISILYTVITFFVLGILFYSLAYPNAFSNATTTLQSFLIFASLLTGIVALVFANRCLSIKPLLLYLVLFEIAFVNIAFLDGNFTIAKIGIFHLITTSSTLFMLLLLSKSDNQYKAPIQKIYRLPTRVFYLLLTLLLLIGIPGTASFVSEFYLLNALINTNAIFVLLYMCLILLLAIVVMHSLQLYAFKKRYLKRLLKPVGKVEHLTFLSIIFFNIACGVAPGIVLHAI